MSFLILILLLSIARINKLSLAYNAFIADLIFAS